MTWVLDKGLARLREQINAAAPNRSKASDGTVGDLAHQARDSDHNPEDPAPAGNPVDQVDAMDITHDPAGGCDMSVVTEAIRTSKDRRVSYVIFNRRIYSGAAGPQPWVWRPYDGINPHDHHGHVSVNDAHHDETQDWQIGIGDDMTLTSEDGIALLKTDAIKNPPWRTDAKTNPFVTWGFAAHDTWNQAYYAKAAAEKTMALVTALAAKLTGDLVDEAAIVAGVLAGLSPEAIAQAVVDALPAELAQQVVDEMAIRLAPKP